MQDRLASAYLQHADRAVIGVDEQGRIDFANLAAGRLFRLDADDLVGERPDRWIGGCDDLLAIAGHRAGGVVGQGEAFAGSAIRRARRADETDVTVAIRVIPLADAGCLPLALELEVRDDARTEADQHRRLVDIIERTPNPVGMADPEGVVFYLNPGFWGFVGLQPRDLPPDCHLSRFHPEWAQARLRAEGLPAARAEGLWEGETALWDASGEELPVLQTIHAHYHRDGSLAYYSTIFRDIAELRDREARLRIFYQALDNLGAYVFCKDSRGRYTYVNAEGCRLFQRPLEAILGQTDEAFFGEADAKDIAENQDKPVLVQGQTLREEEQRFISAEGQNRSFLLVKKPLYGVDGRINGLYGIATDITEQKEREAQLRDFYQILDNLGTYVYCKDSRLRYTYANAQTCALFGRPLEQIIGRTDGYFFGEGIEQAVEEADAVTLAEGRMTRQEKRVYVNSKGESRSFLATKHPLWDDQGRIRGLYGVATDITEQKDREAHLAYEATHDPLTRVLNRSGAEAILERHMKLANRYGRPVCAILADVDHFKTFNDRLGHEAGDRVLIRLTAALSSSLRDADVLARWGGEEFLVIAPETQRDGAEKLAERLRQTVEQRREQEAPAGAGTLSAGVAQYQPGESLRDWVRRSDNALYEAKQAGRNRIRWSD